LEPDGNNFPRSLSLDDGWNGWPKMSKDFCSFYRSNHDILSIGFRPLWLPCQAILDFDFCKITLARQYLTPEKKELGGKIFQLSH
jgi:hypothetical protein